jgi:hypothetical protein
MYMSCDQTLTRVALWCPDIADVKETAGFKEMPIETAAQSVGKTYSE